MKETRLLAGRFLLVRAFGPGGATDAWLAEDGEIDELVTLRILDPALAASWETLRDACRQSRRLAHPRIARVFDFHRGEETPFLSREFVVGNTETSGLAGRPAHEVIAASADVAAALEVAHAHGVVHGDLKHSKILIDAYGQVRVVDFCVTSGLRAAAAAARIEMPLGTTASPQVRAGEAPVEADDVYSLGTIAAGALRAFTAPKELRDLVEGMRNSERDARPNDLGEIRQALAAFSAPQARSSTPAPVTHAFARASTTSHPNPTAQSSDRPSRNTLYVALLGLLGATALTVIFLLPRWVERDTETDPAPEVEEITKAPLIPADGMNTSREEVEAVLGKVLSARNQLEGQAVERWASDRFSRAKELEGKGDRALLENENSGAHGHYSESLDILEELGGERDAVLADVLEDGRVAIENSDSAGAIEKFQLALGIDPGNAQASAGLHRAKTLDEVLEHLSAGEQLEAAGDPGSAAREYGKAGTLDPMWAPAQEALKRANALVGSMEYDRSLSLGLVALARGELATARNSLERARALRPDSPEIVDGLRQLREAESSRAITSYRHRAEAAETAEKWDEAASHYKAILEVQKNLAFAEEGQSRNHELAAMSGRIDELLADPRQMFQTDILEEARRLMSQCQRYVDGKPKLAEQLRHLGIAIRLASTPIQVEFRSDQETEVVIRKVGTLGNFDRRAVPLKPGRYVIIGRRNGYRDVRREILVNPGTKPPVVDVSCTEEI